MKQKRFPVFAERFAKLRGGMTQAEFSEFLGISRPTIGFYENGTRLPDALVLKQIAEKCNVSVDYLLGISEVDKVDVDLTAVLKYTGLSEKSVKNLMAITSAKGEIHEGDGVTIKCISNPSDTLRFLLESDAFVFNVVNSFSNVYGKQLCACHHLQKYTSELKESSSDPFRLTAKCMDINKWLRGDSHEVGYSIYDFSNSLRNALNILWKSVDFESEIKKLIGIIGDVLAECKSPEAFIEKAEEIYSMYPHGVGEVFESVGGGDLYGEYKKD